MLCVQVIMLCVHAVCAGGQADVQVIMLCVRAVCTGDQAVCTGDQAVCTCCVCR